MVITKLIIGITKYGNGKRILLLTNEFLNIGKVLKT